jgi:hypothetical protein
MNIGQSIIVIALCLISYRCYQISEVLRERHEAQVTAECTAPTVCRNEFGHRKDCYAE